MRLTASQISAEHHYERAERTLATLGSLAGLSWTVTPRPVHKNQRATAGWRRRVSTDQYGSRPQRIDA